jgi:hypothetical protein
LTTLLPTLAVAFTAFCVWLAVRIVNRRKKSGWRFWVMAVLVLVFVAHPLSYGPAVWVSYHVGRTPEDHAFSGHVYLPLFWACRHAPESVQNAFQWYAWLWAY